jgi:AcrR family transcriptional regulator|nr:TetR/AcrR family transcriptional regulator [Candidatus Krumholzibacteria bacterium]
MVMDKSARMISPTARKTRQRIFDGAMECIGQNGYEKTTIDDIIFASGVSKGSIYYHFKDKGEIFRELTGFILAEHRERLDQVRQLDVGPWEKICCTIVRVFEKLRWGGARFVAGMELASLAQRNPAIHEIQVLVNDLYQQFFSRLISEGNERGEFMVEDVEKTSYLLYALLDGVFLRSIVQPEYASKAHCQFIIESAKKLLRFKAEE